MFTGIVESLGRVDRLTNASNGTRRLALTTTLPVEDLPLGASIAVDGVCLTVVARAPGRFEADLGPETLACTTLGARVVGDDVHLERPLRLGDALGGHIVAGHVDDVGVVREANAHGDALQLVVRAPASLARYLVPKGSITIDGVSLTVNQVDGPDFRVMLIPHTLAVTTLGKRRPGARVNLEADLLSKHIDRLLAARLDAATRPRAKARSKSGKNALTKTPQKKARKKPPTRAPHSRKASRKPKHRAS